MIETEKTVKLTTFKERNQDGEAWASATIVEKQGEFKKLEMELKREGHRWKLVDIESLDLYELHFLLNVLKKVAERYPDEGK